MSMPFQIAIFRGRWPPHSGCAAPRSAPRRASGRQAARPPSSCTTNWPTQSASQTATTRKAGPCGPASCCRSRFVDRYRPSAVGGGDIPCLSTFAAAPHRLDEVGVADAGQPALGAERHGDDAVEAAAARQVALVPGTAGVEGEGPFAVQIEPVGALELRLRVLRAREVGGAHGCSVGSCVFIRRPLRWSPHSAPGGRGSRRPPRR
jgi:hypothetical protein